jgi:hypothetical protein
MAVVNPFGRVDSEVYLKDELIEGQRIEFNNNLHKGLELFEVLHVRVFLY